MSNQLSTYTWVSLVLVFRDVGYFQRDEGGDYICEEGSSTPLRTEAARFVHDDLRVLENKKCDGHDYYLVDSGVRDSVDKALAKIAVFLGDDYQVTPIGRDALPSEFKARGAFETVLIAPHLS